MIVNTPPSELEYENCDICCNPEASVAMVDIKTEEKTCFCEVCYAWLVFIDFREAEKKREKEMWEELINENSEAVN